MLVLANSNIVSILFLSLLLNGIAAGCELSWTPNAARAYLEFPRTQQNPDCRSNAVFYLVDQKNLSDTGILANYVDVLRPDVTGLIVLDDETSRRLYPALTAMVRAGSLAEAKLIEVIRQNPSERQLRRNATRALRFLHPEDPYAAARLLLAAASSVDRTASLSLREAASWVCEWCGSDHLVVCTALLLTK